MNQRTSSRIAWSLFAAILVANAVGLWLAILARRAGDVWPFIPGSVVFGLVGAVVVSRRPSNTVGWLFLVAPTLGSLMAIADAYAWYGFRTGGHLPGYTWAAWFKVVGVESSFALFVLPALVFPDGRTLGRRWRLVMAGIIVIAAVQTVLTALSNVNFSFNFPVLRDPVRILPSATAGPIYRFLQGIEGSALLLVAAAAVFVRFRRSRGDERLQMKWFTYAVIVAMVGMFVTAAIVANPIVAFVSLSPLIPIAAGVAILKYRLYEIDVVINKTLVYGALAAFITLVYVAIVVGIGAAVGEGDKPNLALSIVATAVVAVAFQPVRDRVQRLANRLVYGVRATPYEVLAGFVQQVGGTYAAEEILPRMARALGTGTAAASATVWLRTGSELRAGASWPESEPGGGTTLAIAGDDLPAIPGASFAAPVFHQGEMLGALSITKPPAEPVSANERKLAEDLAGQAGLVLRNVALTEDLLARLRDIESSRARIVSAEDEERARIQRRIGDGAGRELEAVARALDDTVASLPGDPDRAMSDLASVIERSTVALESLRDVARGIYPPLLADKGLAAALEAEARRARVPVDVFADGIGRYAEDVESTVYFCCVEALRNAAAADGVRTVHVTVREHDRELRFVVEHDGPAMEADAANGWLEIGSMADRVAALDGDLTVETPAGGRTRVVGSVPVGTVSASAPAEPLGIGASA